MLEITIDRQTSDTWSEIVSQFADASIYQSWAYGAVRWGSGNLSHLVVRDQGEIVAGAQLRIARVPFLRAGVAYLRWGPMCHRRGRTIEPPLVTETIRLLCSEYCERRGLTLEIIPNACVETARGAAYRSALAKSGFEEQLFQSPYRTVLVDLAAPIESMRKRLDQKWRNQLNRSEKNAVMVEVSESPQSYAEFMRLYEGMLARKQFETSVDPAEFGRIHELLSDSSKMQIFLAKKDAEAVGALVCSLSGDTALYVLGATNELGRELKASYHLQWQAMMWYKARGASFYDLGGIDPIANPGGYHFKSGFGGEEVVHLPSYFHHGNTLSSIAHRGLGLLRNRKRKALEPVLAAS